MRTTFAQNKESVNNQIRHWERNGSGPKTCHSHSFGEPIQYRQKGMTTLRNQIMDFEQEYNTAVSHQIRQ